jgi:hypothetical protein
VGKKSKQTIGSQDINEMLAVIGKNPQLRQKTDELKKLRKKASPKDVMMMDLVQSIAMHFAFGHVSELQYKTVLNRITNDYFGKAEIVSGEASKEVFASAERWLSIYRSIGGKSKEGEKGK